MRIDSSPVIIIGMHRSGTSMITRLLRELGLHVGWWVDSNCEDRSFRRINNWMLRHCGASWDSPLAIRGLMADPVSKSLAADYAQVRMASPKAAWYLGPRGLLIGTGKFRFDGPWGWKDPRNTFTLPVWREVFPKCKVLHVYRHGVDVAQSLAVRDEAQHRERVRRYKKHRPLYFIMARRGGGFHGTYRCAQPQGGIALWKEYVDEARRHVIDMGDAAMEVCYERFLADPRTHLESMTSFIDLRPSSEKLTEASRSVRSDRAFAFLANDELSELAHQEADVLAAYGYGPDGFLQPQREALPVG